MTAPTTILVVDDEDDVQPLILGLFRTKIKQGLYSFRFVTSGREALQMLEQDNTISLVLLDINMPELDGLTVLSQLPALNPLLTTIIVSAYGDIGNIRTAMNRGAFDFVCKPIDFDDLQVTLDKAIQHSVQVRETYHLRGLDALKTRFFENVTHELRTPITLILSPVQQLLQRYSETEELHRKLLTVERNAQKLHQLINQLLDLAKLEAGHLSLVPIPGDLGYFIEQITQAFAPVTDGSALTLSYENSLTHHYLFDAGKFELIVHNLLSNALKYTGEGQIAVRVAETDMGIELIVRDTGIGIPPEKLPYIFNRFYQVDQTVSTQSATYQTNPGTGIGLSLVKELVQLMGGTVAVSSQCKGPESGSVFTIQLPLPVVGQSDSALKAAAPRLFVNGPSLGLESLAMTPPTPSTDESSPVVLLVEDNPELGAYLSDELQESFRIMLATDGIEGWQIVRNELPDLVLTDVMMPGMNGYELTDRIKSHLETDHIAVLMLTAKATQQNRIEGLQHGADDYITKPFDIDELRLKMQNLLLRQQKLRDRYYRQFIRKDPAEEPAPVQNTFILRLNDIIENHLDDSSFGVDDLAREIGMSRRTLHRKL
ncbi:MAG: response regulator, partial [Cytophagaceae bacterium]